MKTLLAIALLAFVLPCWGQMATNFANIDDSLTNWTTCDLDDTPPCNPGGSGAPLTDSLTVGNVDHTLDAGSMLGQMTVPGGLQTNILWTYKAGADDDIVNLSFDIEVYLASNCALVGSYEYDQFLFGKSLPGNGANGWNFMFGTQCNKGSGKWEVFNQSAGSWVSRPLVPCSMTCGAWHEIAEAAHRIAGDYTGCAGGTRPCMYYDSLTIDGVLQPNYAITEPAGPLNSTWTSNLGMQFQVDVPSSVGTGVSFSEYLDSATFTATDGNVRTSGGAWF